VAFPAKIAFPPEDLPVLVEAIRGHGDTGILETGAEKFNIRPRPSRPCDGVKSPQLASVPR
jgi:hypothetical protein